MMVLIRLFMMFLIQIPIGKNSGVLSNMKIYIASSIIIIIIMLYFLRPIYL